MEVKRLTMVITKGNSDPHGKRKVFLACHPDDYNRWVKKYQTIYFFELIYSLTFLHKLWYNINVLLLCILHKLEQIISKLKTEVVYEQ